MYLPGFASNVDLMWDIPSYRRFLEGLSSFSRLIIIDRRGLGCSDRLPPGRAPTLEKVTEDVLAVMEVVSSTHATVLAIQEAAFSALLLAAAHAWRVGRLVLFGASPSWVRSDDLPDEWSTEQWESTIRSNERMSSAIDGMVGYIRDAVPSLLGDDEAEWAMVSLIFNTQGVVIISRPRRAIPPRERASAGFSQLSSTFEM